MAGILDEFLLVFKPIVRGSGFQSLNKQIQTTHNNLFDLKNLFKGFIGFDLYNMSKQFVGSLVEASKELGAMNSRFFAITKSEKLANDELEWAFKLAKNTATDIKSIADSYSIFYAAARKGLGNDKTREVFQNWTEVSRVLHLTPYQFERVTYALREMVSKGVVYSQDLRMQIGTHVPNAIGLAQKAVNDLGITGTDWFEKFQKQSKGNQEMINQFLVSFSKYAKADFASPEALRKSLEQTDSVVTALTNTWKLFIYNLTKSGFTKDLIKTIRGLNVVLEAITKHAHAIYLLMKTAVVLFGLMAGGKALGAGIKFLTLLLRVGRVIKAGKGLLLFTGLATTLKTLSNVGKFLKDIFYLSKLSQGYKLLMAGGLMAKFGKFAPLLTRLAPFMASIVGFITNPYVLGALLIAGGVILLGWILKTFCPNVWKAILNWWITIEAEIRRLWLELQASPFGQAIMKWADKQSETKSDVNKTINAWYDRVRKEGGIIGNSRYSFSEMQAQQKAMDYARRTTRNNPMDIAHGGILGNLLYKTFSSRQREYNQKVEIIIKSDMTGQQKLQAMKDSNPSLFNTLVRHVKNAIKEKGK